MRKMAGQDEEKVKSKWQEYELKMLTYLNRINAVCRPTRSLIGDANSSVVSIN